MAAAGTSEWKEGENGEEEGRKARRGVSAGVSSEHQVRALHADDQAGALSLSSPLRSPPPPSAWPTDDVSEGGKKKRRERSSEQEIRDDSVGPDLRIISGRKRRQADRRRGSKGEREGDGRGGAAAGGGEGGTGAGAGDGRGGRLEGEREDSVGGGGSLLELRDALRSREKDLLRLKRDVGAVATSAGSFKHLMASLGSVVKAGSSAGFGCYDDDEDDGNDGTNEDNRPRTSQSRATKPRAGPELGGASAAVDEAGEAPLREKDAARRSYRKEEADDRSKSSRSPVQKAVHREASFARSIDLLQDGTHAISHSLSSSPPQQPLSTSKGADVTVGGSRLVASAHGALKRMRAVLEQREVDARRAKEDAGKMVSLLQQLRTSLTAKSLDTLFYLFVARLQRILLGRHHYSVFLAVREPYQVDYTIWSEWLVPASHSVSIVLLEFLLAPRDFGIYPRARHFKLVRASAGGM